MARCVNAAVGRRLWGGAGRSKRVIRYVSSSKTRVCRPDNYIFFLSLPLRGFVAGTRLRACDQVSVLFDHNP